MNDQTKQKILYVITKSNYGGAQRYVHELALAMQEQGHTVAVACGGNGMLAQKLQANAIRIFPIKSLQRDISLYRELQALFGLAQTIRTFDPDIIHLNSSKAGVLGVPIARLLGVPEVVFTAHGWPFLEPRAWWWRTMTWLGSYLTALFAHRVIVVSQYDNEKTNMPGISKKLKTIHTAVPAIKFLAQAEARQKLFSPVEITEHSRDMWLVTNAELNHNKNLFTAINAVVSHNNESQRKMYYSIIGDGELKDQLAEHIKNHQAESYIKLHGYVADARVYLKAFDCFLLPSKKEGLPYALLEAGAAKLPCIASEVGGIPEVVYDQKTGLLINPLETSTITIALAKIITEPVAAQGYADALKNHILSHFSLEKMVAGTAHVYNV